MSQPCKACPFLRTNAGKELPLSAEQHAHAVVAGGFACCHVNLGACVGAAMFRANSKIPGRHPEVFDTVADWIGKPPLAPRAEGV